MARRRVRPTSRVICGLVCSFPPETGLAFTEDKDDDPPPERHKEPIPPRSEAADLFAEVELGDGAICLRIVEHDLVGRVQRRRRAADEEDEVGPLERQADRQRRLGEICRPGRM